MIIFVIYFLSNVLKATRIKPLITDLTVLLSGIILVSVLGCDSAIEIDPSETGQAFYPLTEGDYREYEVTQIKYSILGHPDTLKYYLKEKIGENYINQTGGNTFILNRYKRSYDTLAWEIDSVWTVMKSETNVIVTENNIPYTKLIFPVVDQKQWDGNAFNIFREELYTYEDTYQSFSSGNINYNSTLKVIQASNPDSIVMKDLRTEIYAEDIGLIYKETIILYYCTENECLGEQIIEQGMDFKQELIGYGNE